MKGHRFGLTGSDGEARALIAFLETLSVRPTPRATVLGDSTNCRSPGRTTCGSEAGSLSSRFRKMAAES
jgi:hypothetical protein